MKLCKVTILSGVRDGFARVVIPSSAIIADRFGVVGRGPFVGFALTEDSAKPRDFVILGGRLNSPNKDRSFICCGSADIKAGVYRLYLLGKGHAKVNLSLAGLSQGITRVTPSQPTRVQINSLKPTTTGSAASQFYAAGALGRIGDCPHFG
jgi:hypothetical protein